MNKENIILNLDLKNGNNINLNNSIINNNYDEYSDCSSFSDSEEETTKELLDVDLKNLTNPYRVSKYAESIFNNYDKFVPEFSTKEILEFHENFNINDFEDQIKWLINISNSNSFGSDILYNSVTYFYIYLSKKRIAYQDLKLLTLTCLFLSLKVEFPQLMSLEELLNKVNLNIDKKEIIIFEKALLIVLNFKLSYSTSKIYSRRFLDISNFKIENYTIANAFCEIALQKIEFLDYSPKIIAVSAVCLSYLCINSLTKTKDILKYGNFDDVKEIKKCCELLLKNIGDMNEYRNFLQSSLKEQELFDFELNFSFEIINKL